MIVALRLQALAVVVALTGAWELSIRAGFGNAMLLPPPSTIVGATFTLIADGGVFGPASVTLRRLAAGFSICVAGGTALGILTGSVAVVDAMVAPMLEAIRSLPKAALVPALILFFGIGDATNIASVALAGVFPVWINVARAVRQIDPVLRESAITLGLTPVTRVIKITVPAMVPALFAGARISVGLCFVVAVLSEMTMGSDGIGALVIDLQRSFRVRQMYAWIVILAVLGLLLNAAIGFAERRIVFWVRGEARS